MTKVGSDGQGPVGDSDGYILRAASYTYLNLADAPSFQAPPADGSWSFGWDLRWDGGGGYVWGLGGRLRMADTPDRWSVAVSGDGTLQVFGPNGGSGGGGAGPRLTPGEWYTCRLSFDPRGVATLTVNGVDYPLANTSGPVAPRWHDDLIIGGKATTWPEVLSSEVGATGRIRNLRLAERYGNPAEMLVPLDDGNRHLFRIDTASGGLSNGHLLLRCANDGQGEVEWGVRDLAVRSFVGGIGMYVTNAQGFTISDALIEGHRGLFMQKNVYEFSIRNVKTHGSLVATQAVNNAFQGSYDGGTVKGGMVGFVAENSYGATVRGTWITTCSRLPLLLGGDECVVGVDRAVCVDEGAGPDVIGLVLLRQGMATFTGCAIQRAYTTAGKTILVDGGGPHNFVGGEILTKAGGPPLFDVAGTLDGKIHMTGVNTGGHDVFEGGREADFEVS
jgi:hypothetical protein